ncbi:hypothetical protein Q7C09_09180 [Heyndrickxia coagulans]|uniref:hypothetical protein n=1 Tax=Heyndrickxia coagulans TaxID=1398 RepID=UPI00281145F2|nr:hypothetical protein [Heyndrickxia coagulans]WMM88871.1 hypothetical protein Q7C09_09180 [Heyndrickxia coagulans]
MSWNTRYLNLVEKNLTHTIEIPFWTIGDFHDMDEMHEEYAAISGTPIDGKMVYDRRMQEWKILIH